MKTRQPYMRAIFTKRADNARNMNGDKELIREYVLVDKKTERHIVTCRAYMGKSRNASTVYASLWVSHIQPGKFPAEWEYGETNGRGQAGGYGYHKTSAAIADAISSAGIELYGSPYARPVNGDTAETTRAMLKTRAHIGGCGDSSVDAALLAIAHAAGYADCIMIS